jgi:hypothetical protein
MPEHVRGRMLFPVDNEGCREHGEQKGNPMVTTRDDNGMKFSSEITTAGLDHRMERQRALPQRRSGAQSRNWRPGLSILSRVSWRPAYRP